VEYAEDSLSVTGSITCYFCRVTRLLAGCENSRRVSFFIGRETRAFSGRKSHLVSGDKTMPKVKLIRIADIQRCNRRDKRNDAAKNCRTERSVMRKGGR
jgi:hypothetical protein